MPLLLLLLLGLLAGGGAGAWYWWRSGWLGTPDDLYFLPDGCQFVGSADVPACLASKTHERLKKLGAGIGAGEEEAFRRFTGVPLADVTRLTFGARLDEDPDWVVVVHTSRAVTTTDLRADGVPEPRASKVGRFTLYETGERAFCLPARDRVVVGKPEALRRVLLRNRTPELAAGLDAACRGVDRALALALDPHSVPRRFNRLDDLDLSPATAAVRRADTVLLESTPADPLDVQIVLGCADAASALEARKQLDAAAEQIGRAPGLPPAVGQLLRALKWDGEEGRLTARLMLPPELLSEPLLARKQARPEYWVAALGDEDARRRADARRWLLAHPAEALAALPASLRDRDARRRQAAAELLGELGNKAAGAAPALADLVADPEVKVRRAAIVALGKMGAKARGPAFPALLRAVGDDDPAAARDARAALDQVGLPVTKELDTLVSALRKTRLGAKPRLFVLDALAGMQLETSALVPILVDTLQDPEPALRRRAAWHLGKHGGKTRKEAVPALLSALKDNEAEVRAAAVAALDGLGTFPQAEIPLLIEAYRNASTPPDGRAALVRWLGEAGPEAKDTVFPILLDARNRPDPAVRKAAAAALERIGVAATVNVAHLLEALRAPGAKEENRVYAVRMLGEAGPRARKAARTLVELLNDPSPELRGATLAALQRIGPPGDEEMDLVLHSLGDPDASVEARRYGAAALAESPLPPARASRLLTKALGDKDAGVRRTAAHSLARLRQESPEVIQAYDAALSDPDSEVRMQVTKALVALPPDHCPQATLLKAFADDEDAVARRAVEGLVRKGTPTRVDVPMLVSALRHKKARVRIFAADALAELGGDAAGATDALTDALRDAEPSVRMLALSALRKIKDESTGPAVAALLKDENETLRLHAAVTLLRLHQEARQALPIVVEAAASRNRAGRDLAAESLGWVGPWARDAVPYLLDAFQKDETRPLVQPLLVKLGKAAVPGLRKLLADDRQRLAAIEALGQIGPDAREALLDITTLAVKSRNAEVREAAKAAAQKMQTRK